MPVRRVRGSDSALVERVTQVTYEAATTEWTPPDGCWDLVVLQKKDRTVILQTGLISAPVQMENDEGDSYLAISFKPGVFVPKLPGSEMVDRGVVHPLVTRREFFISRHRTRCRRR